MKNPYANYRHFDFTSLPWSHHAADKIEK
jgi:hypothetical protein